VLAIPTACTSFVQGMRNGNRSRAECGFWPQNGDPRREASEIRPFGLFDPRFRARNAVLKPVNGYEKCGLKLIRKETHP
jgi:hypothetical protein